jgi:hypothetical protein
MQGAGSHCIFENITFVGLGVDGGSASASQGITFSGLGQTNWTIRHCTFQGFDVGIKAYDHITGLLVYDCDFIGNNIWSKTYENNGGAPNLTWNDTGIGLPGLGCCAWENSFTSHGDTFKFGDQSHTWESRACYVHHNWISRCGDDGVEFDDMSGNCAAYNNIFVNSGTACSVDGVNGGPVGFFRNIALNQTRGPFKLTSVTAGTRIWNNTIICTTKENDAMTNQDYGMYAATSTAYGFDFRNNVVIYRGANDLINMNVSFQGSVNTDYNAWYPDGKNIKFGSGSTYVGLAAAKAGYGTRMQHDVIVASEQLASAITLGADYTTEYTGHFDTTLVGGSTGLAAGIAIPGCTDGYSTASPDMGALIRGQFFGAIGCTWNRAAWPNYAFTQAIAAWTALSGTAISSVDPATPPSTGTGSVNGKITPWNSNSLDERTSDFWNVATGGHTDYGGNEADKLRLEVHTPAWQEVLTCTVTVSNANYYADGRPTSRHSYLAQQFNPFNNRVMMFGGARFSDGGILATVDGFNIITGDYDASSTYTNIPASISSVEYKPTAIDPRNGNIYMFCDNGNIERWNIASNTWTNLGSGYTVDRIATPIWDSRRKRFCMINGNTMRTFSPPSTGGSTTLTGTTIPTGNNADFQGNSSVYIPSLDIILHYVSNTGGTVYKVDLATNVASDFGTTGGASIPNNSHGSQNRFRFVPNLRGIIYQPDRTNCWFLRVY